MKCELDLEPEETSWKGMSKQLALCERQGFTLLEVLVSMAVLSVVLSFILSTYSSSVKLLQQGRLQLQQTEGYLDLVRDLRADVFSCHAKRLQWKAGKQSTNAPWLQLVLPALPGRGNLLHQTEYLVDYSLLEKDGEFQIQRRVVLQGEEQAIAEKRYSVRLEQLELVAVPDKQVGLQLHLRRIVGTRGIAREESVLQLVASSWGNEVEV